jgi:Outer membrane protein beta-barrel domain
MDTPRRSNAISRGARRAAVVAVLLLTPFLTGIAAAQERQSPSLDLSAGWVGFGDDGIVSEGMVGGAGRFCLTPRLAIGPELLYISGDNHSHLVLTGNLTFDILAPRAGRAPAVTPFLVVGAGMFQTRESFAAEDYTYTEGAFTAGGGIRAAVSDRVTVGVDARIGWEAHLRINGVVGVRLGR